MRVVVDTNFVIALVVEDDINHEDAVEKFQALEKAYLPAIAVAELAYFFIKHRVDLSVLEVVLSDPRVELVEHKYTDYLFATRNKHLVKSYDDFNDILILATALRLKLKLLTYDKELEKLWEKFAGISST